MFGIVASPRRVLSYCSDIYYECQQEYCSNRYGLTFAGRPPIVAALPRLAWRSDSW